MQEENKTNILIASLQERYEALRTIRGRVESAGLWSLGVLFGASAWLIQSGLVVTYLERNLFLVATLLGFLLLRFHYLKDLEKGFKGQQKVAARIEKALKLYEPGFFDDAKESIYETEWQHAGTSKGVGKFFYTTYNLLYLGFGCLAVAILLLPICHLTFY